jgi:hypothetical protein
MNLPMNINLSWLDKQPTTVEEYKKYVQERLKRYDYVITEENRIEAEQDKKKLNEAYNKLHKDRMDAYKEFDTVKKEMIATENLIKSKIDDINSQFKELDQHFIEEKQLEITEYFSSLNFSLVPLSKLFDKKWLNKTCKNWKEQLDNKINQINKELDVIDSFGISEQEKTEVKGYYLDCLDLATARNMFDEQKKHREAIKKQQGEVSKQKKQKPLQAPYDFVEPQTKKEEQNTKEPKKQRIKVEFVAERPFYDEMNILIKKYRPQVKILEREDIE